MSTEFSTKKLCGIVLCSVLCLAGTSFGSAAPSQRKTKKPALPPLPSGPTGHPVPQIPLDSMKPVAPQVSFQNGQLTIVAPNSTLGDILRAVQKQTGAEIEIPREAQDRVATHLGPGPAQDVMSDLLNGSHYNYILLGSSSDQSALTRVVLVAKGAAESPAAGGPSLQEQQALGIVPPPADAQPDAEEPAPDADAEATEEPADDSANADQAAQEAEQQQPQQAPDQPAGVKTPQEMLQEMQQRQLQLQQQQPPGQPPIPGGLTPRPPQEQQ